MPLKDFSVNHRSRSIKRAWLVLGFYLLLSMVCATCLGGNLSSLAVPDTSSPRTTLESCQHFFNNYADLIRRQSVLGEDVSKRSMNKLENKIARCFDLSGVPNERIDDIASEVSIYLQEILDRIELPALQDIPDAATVISEKLTRWQVPGTDISVIRVTDGPRQGEWLFSSETVARLEDDFHEVRSMPYRPDAKVGAIGPLGGMFEYTVVFPESEIPANLIRGLPSWAKEVYWEQPLWKWLAVIAILMISILLFAGILLASQRKSRRRDINGHGVHWEKLLPPLSWVVIALFADHLIDEIVGMTGSIDALIETILWTIAIIGSAWTLIVVINLLAEAVIKSHWIDPKDVNANLISISGRVLGVTLALWVLVQGAENIGLSLIPVIAGLGVGGLAVALAVRPTLENLIGGFVLFIDKPVRVGDRCRFGDQQLGDIEKIGLRSTRIRTRENTLLTIPNAEFSQMQLENLSKRQFILYRINLSLRYETTEDQLRYVMARTREMLISHPKVSPKDLRVRFRDLGEYSLDVEIFAYTRTNDLGEYWAIREDLNLRIMGIVKEAGTSFAFPSTTEYFIADSGLDAERGLAAEERVEEWRSQGKLPFPEFDQEQSQRIEDTLDYPPEGSPHHQRRAGN